MRLPRRLLPTPAALVVAAAATALAACQTPAAAEPPPGDPAALTADMRMVSSAHPLASRAGLETMRAGGNAVDAAIATQMVLTLVEPGESGIGGGGFLLFRDAETGEITAYDGRETAPMQADPRRFMARAGFTTPFFMAVMGGRSVGTPGLVAMLHEAHADHGELDWEELFDPAIELAEEGFPISPRLHRQIRTDPTLRVMRGTRQYFFGRFGRALRVGHLRDNPALAETLRSIRDEGPEVFYEGELAEAIVNAVSRRTINPGDLTLDDLKAYEPVKRDVVCGPYRDYTVCGMPLPSSGGTTVLQILGMLEHFDMAEKEPGSLEATHIFAEASRLAFADRNAYLGDTDASRALVPALLEPDYLKQRADKIDPERALRSAREGAIPVGEADDTLVRQDLPPEAGSTTHFSLVDDDRNAVSITTSIEQPFGSRLMVRGFLLNNQLTDFAFRPEIGGLPAPNAVEPGKRPLSAMSPTLVFDADGELRLVVGSPGGSRIIGYTAQTLVGVLDWDMDIQTAAGLGNVIHRNDRLELERGTEVAGLARELRGMGHRVRVRTLDSGVHGIEVFPEGLRGGADLRRGGAALGD